MIISLIKNIFISSIWYFSLILYGIILGFMIIRLDECIEWFLVVCQSCDIILEDIHLKNYFKIYYKILCKIFDEVFLIVWQKLNFCYIENYIFFTEYLNYPIFLLFAFFFCFSSFSSLFFLNYLGFRGVFIFNLVPLVLFWLSCLPYISYFIQENGFYYINIGKWLFLNTNFKVFFDFYIDIISFSFTFLTLSIGVFVYMFTFSYFRYEPLVDRLLVLINLFIISMIFLVCSGNLVCLFLGWEMIGLTSFFLINFWVNKISTLKAAFKAFSFNKLSDFFLLLNILLIFNNFFTVDILTLNTQSEIALNKFLNINYFINISLNDLICLLFIGCAFIKSAQLGAHIWLPDSMEAPVPASALIHSATLVSAGVFLLLRFNFFFDGSVIAQIIICLIGSMTAFYGGLISMFQSDTKKILAYSTISHCGFLMVLISFHIVEFTLLYLYVHGFFKAAVFMCVGNINHVSKNNQDFKQMGFYFKLLPFECIMCAIGLINLAGLPFSLGFFIKHLLFVAINTNFFFYYFILLNLIFAALTGLFYCSRLFYYVFFDFKKNKQSVYYSYTRNSLNSVHYSNTTWLSTYAIFGLFLFSYIFSFFLFYNFLGSILQYSETNELFKSTVFFFTIINNKWMLFNFSIFNWIVIVLVLSISIISWRKINTTLNIQFFFWLFIFLFIFKLFF